MSDTDEGGFLSRWSRRKAQVRQGGALADEPARPAAIDPPPAPAVRPDAAELPAPATSTPPAAPAAPAEPAPTLEDVALLGRDSDYRRFVAPDVGTEVKNAALKKLFSDPHFNVMDGLDTYIEDYGQPNPISPAMLRQLVQGDFLGLFREEKEAEAQAAARASLAAPEAAPLTPPVVNAASGPAPDENADLRLQPDPAPERTGLEASPVQDPGRPD